MAKIIKHGLRDLVYKELHEMIENSRFTPGGRINVEKLTRELEVSSTPVWQAIGLLEREGFLKYVPNVGVFMQEISPKEAVELYAVRETLECMAAELAVNSITKQELTEMKQNLEEQRRVIDECDLVAYSRLDFDFHSIVYNAADNHCLLEMLGDLKRKMRPMTNQMEIILEELYEDHVGILHALENKDGNQASHYFRTHNERMKNHIWNKSQMETKHGA